MERRVAVPGAYDLAASLRMWRLGPRDPTMKIRPGWVARATWTAAGPATVELRHDGSESVLARGWGPGARRVVERAEWLLALDDDASSFAPTHPLVARLKTAHPGLRMSRAPSVWETLAGVVLQQRVTFHDAVDGWRVLSRRFGGPAPGPHRLVMPPNHEAIADAPYYTMRPVDRGRAETLRRLAQVERRKGWNARLEPLPVSEQRRRLGSVRGVGPWTTALTLGSALADADAVPVGDLHLPRLVAQRMTGDATGDDERMLALLAPFAGHRFRVLRLLLAGPGSLSPALANAVERWIT